MTEIAAKTDTDAPKIDLGGDALIDYVALKDPILSLRSEIAAKQAEFAEVQAKFDESILPMTDKMAELTAKAKTLVDELGMDVYGLVGETSTGKKGPRGPRDPRRGDAVRAAMNGERQIKGIVEAANESLSGTDADPVDAGYVQSIINTLAKDTNKYGTLTVAGEKRAQTYLFTPAPKVEVETPAEA